MWFKKNKWKIIVPAAVLALLVFAFFCGGEAPEGRGAAPENGVQTGAHDLETGAPDPALSAADGKEHGETGGESQPPAGSETTPPEAFPQDGPAPQDTDHAPQGSGQNTDPSSPEGSQNTAPSSPEGSQNTAPSSPEGEQHLPTTEAPETGGNPLPVEPGDVTVTDAAFTCTISISCGTILDNISLCDPEKTELVPEDGVILAPTDAVFYEGESVFNILQRTCKVQKIHMEYMTTPIYNSAYIEGINNLYEFDVGELSGWMYRVNGWFPNYGCSRYQLKDGDVIEFIYTCDLGADIGGSDAYSGQAES